MMPQRPWEEPTMPKVIDVHQSELDDAQPSDTPVETVADAPVTADMLIEDVSIDGMCGVY